MEKILEMNGDRDRRGPFPPSAHHYEYDDASDNTRRSSAASTARAHSTLYDGSYSPWLYEFPLISHISIPSLSINSALAVLSFVHMHLLDGSKCVQHVKPEITLAVCCSFTIDCMYARMPSCPLCVFSQ